MNDIQKKRPTGFRVDEKTMQQINAAMALDGSRSFQQFCDRAVQFYIGFLVSEKKDGYLSQVIQATLRGLFSQFESDLRRDNSKVAIAIAELMLATAATTEFTQDELRRIRGRANEIVSKYGGPSTLGNAQKDVFEMFALGGDEQFHD